MKITLKHYEQYIRLCLWYIESVPFHVIIRWYKYPSTSHCFSSSTGQPYNSTEVLPDTINGLETHGLIKIQTISDAIILDLQ